MKTIALEKARCELVEVRSAVDRLERAANAQDMHREWRTFLASTYSFWEALKRGSSGRRSQSHNWWRDKEAIRKSDHLHHYLHCCRSEREHGLDPVAVTQPANTAFSGNGHMQFYEDKNGNIALIRTTPLPGSDGVKVTFTPETIRVVAVRDEHGRGTQMVQPPLSSALDLARGASEALESILEEAEQLPTDD